MTACLGESSYITRLEHAQARLTLSYNRRGDLAIHLVSPMGTRSTLLAARCLLCTACPLPCAHVHSFTHTALMVTEDSQQGTVGILGGWFCPLGLSHIAETPGSTHPMPWLCAFPYTFSESSG